MMRVQRKRKIFGMERDQIWLVLLVGWILLIYGHSLTPAELSSKESGWVRELLLRTAGIFGSDGRWLTGHIVRKAAHFFEYFVLGILLMQNVHGLWKNTGHVRKNRVEKLLPLVFAVLAIPFCDETIQLFIPGRAGQITDVWLDISGAVCGILSREAIVFLAGCLIRSSRANRPKHLSRLRRQRRLMNGR